jgi:hypothetical protein
VCAPGGRGAQVEELFVDKVHQLVYFKDMAIRSRKAAIGFAEAAVKHHYKNGLSLNAEQNTKGGIMLHRSAALRQPAEAPLVVLLARRPLPAG